MTSGSTQFTLTTLVAAADEILENAGFKLVEPSTTGSWRAAEARVYEDAHSIVCIAVYETWASLSSQWIDDQANLVGLISNHFASTDAKAWDGYLVLLTPSVVPTIERRTAIEIQRNTLHVRKLFAAADELETADPVRRTLLPLLPLEIQDTQRPSNLLHTLPLLLTARGIDAEASGVAIAAFLEQRPIVEAIHRLLAARAGDMNED